MTDALVEKVSDAVRPHLYWEGVASSVVARAAILAVLEHFSEPSNITAFRKGQHEIVASVMRADRDEVSRG